MRAHHNRRHPLPSVTQGLRRRLLILEAQPHTHTRIAHHVIAIDRTAITATEDDVGLVRVQRHRTGLAAGSVAPFLLRTQRIAQPP